MVFFGRVRKQSVYKWATDNQEQEEKPKNCKTATETKGIAEENSDTEILQNGVGEGGKSAVESKTVFLYLQSTEIYLYMYDISCPFQGF